MENVKALKAGNFWISQQSIDLTSILHRHREVIIVTSVLISRYSGLIDGKGKVSRKMCKGRNIDVNLPVAEILTLIKCNTAHLNGIAKRTMLLAM